jgi:hypothetical protein
MLHLLYARAFDVQSLFAQAASMTPGEVKTKPPGKGGKGGKGAGIVFSVSFVMQLWVVTVQHAGHSHERPSCRG